MKKTTDFEGSKKEMTDKLFMDVEDVKEVLEVSDGKAYQIIRMLNQELKEQGYMVVQGKTLNTF